MNSFNENENDKINKNSNLIVIKQFKNIKRKLFDFFIIILNLINLALISSLMTKKTNLKKILKENNLKTKKNMKVELDKTKMLIAKNQKTFNNNRKDLLLYEKNMPHLNEIIKKRTFEKRLPLPKEIKCTPHFRKEELIAFLSLLNLYFSYEMNIY